MSNSPGAAGVTINAAKMSFKDKDLGTVEVGKLADLTIVDGNPLDDLKYAADVEVRGQERHHLLAGPDHGAIQDAGSARGTPEGPGRIRHGVQGGLEQVLCRGRTLAGD